MPRYDLVVAGTGLGGLVAAALLARKGKRTVLIDPSEFAGGLLSPVRKDGFIFSPGPSLSFGFERGGPLQAICSELAVSQSTSALSPCYQVALPGRRISVFQEVSETLDELRREFPKEIDALVRFYEDIRKMATRIARNRLFLYHARHRGARSFLRRYAFSRELRAFIDVPAIMYFQKPAEELSILSLVTLFDSSPLFMHGGFNHLVEQLCASIMKSGGEILHGESHIDMMVENGQVNGVKLSSGRYLEASSVVLLNVAPTGACATLFLGIRSNVIPLGMSPNVLCLPDYERPEYVFSLSVSDRDHESAAPPGMRAVTATFPLLAQEGELRENLTALIGELLPFLEQYLVTVDMYDPAPAAYAIPSRQVLKPMSDAAGGPLLNKTALRRLYLLADDLRSPAQAVFAARKFVERIA